MSDKLQFVAKLRQAKACRTSNRILTGVAGRLSRIPFRRMSENLANFINPRSRCCEELGHWRSVRLSGLAKSYKRRAPDHDATVRSGHGRYHRIRLQDLLRSNKSQRCKLHRVQAIYSLLPLAEELGKRALGCTETPSCLSPFSLWEKGWGWGLRLKKPSCLA